MKRSKAVFHMGNSSRANLQLNEEEEDILRGKYGGVLQKVIKTVVLYGQACGAKKLVPIEGAAHLVISIALAGLGLRLEMVDELVHAGLKTKVPFTVDPRPFDIKNAICSKQQEKLFGELYRNQGYYEKQLKKLGLRDANSFTCTSYLPEVGNIPKESEVLAWSESSAVIFANSVLGARTNRNGAVLDLLCNISGRAPYHGLLTDEGRQAKWLVVVKTSELPHPQLLGGAIGKKVQEDVPYIIGLDRFLGSGLNIKTRDFLKDMGASCAALGACGLYHVENITPEALEQERNLLVKDYRTYIIDSEELKNIRNSYLLLWRNIGAKPKRCLIGCPHLSLQQLGWWTTMINDALKSKNKNIVNFEVILCAAPDVIEEFKGKGRVYDQLMRMGVRLSSMCIETFMNNPLVAREPVITNSNKLRAYTTAKFLLDQEILEIIAGRELKKGGME